MEHDAYVNKLTMLSRVGLNLVSRAAQSVRAFSATPVGDLYNPTEEHLALRQMVRKFAEDEVDPQALEYNREEKFNVELFRKLGDLGLLGITADEECGGSGMDATAVCIAHEELAAADSAFTLSYLAHSMLFVNNLDKNGSMEQKMRYLPDACSGVSIGGMCMSEPGAGTDVLGMASNAKRDGDKYILNGSKMWITNGAINDTTLGDIFLVYARTAAGGGAGKHSYVVIPAHHMKSPTRPLKGFCVNLNTIPAAASMGIK